VPVARRSARAAAPRVGSSPAPRPRVREAGHGPPLRGLREPLTGWRGVQVRERRRGREFAEFVGHLVEEIYPKAEKIRLVVDNLNIHSAASFYEVFDAERARRLSRRIEFCYTPVHGSWLNMAEIEISVLVRQCLGARRIPEAGILGREAMAWCEERNRLGASVDWRFSTTEARTKLRRLYPSIER
jgi:hypothetical protein